jgi:hypothetical protein
MKTKILLLGAVVAAFTVTAMATNPVFSPRAAGNQARIANSPVSATVVTSAYADTTTAVLAPRAAGNQLKVVKGLNGDINPALVCAKSMGGSPKAVAECTAHTTMPACAAFAMNK